MRILTLLVLFFCIMPAQAADDETTIPYYWSLPPVQVTSTSGTPLQDTEVGMYKATDPLRSFYSKQTSGDGTVTFSNQDYVWSHETELPVGHFNGIVLAKGYAPTTFSWSLPSKESLIVKPLDNGTTVIVTLEAFDGTSPPDYVVPHVFPVGFGFSMYPSEVKGNRAAAAWPTSLGKGRFEITLDPKSTAPLQLVVDHPGYLQGFLTTIETTAALQQKTVSIKLPKPGTLVTKLKVPSAISMAKEGKEVMFLLFKEVSLGGVHSISTWSEQAKKLPLSGEVTLVRENIAPGKYVISLFADNLQKSATQTIDAGATATVVFNYPEPSAKPPGTTTANLIVRNLTGEPAAGLPYRLLDENYEVLAEGNLSDDGTTTVLNLPGTSDKLREFQLHEGNEFKRIGILRFETGDSSGTFQLTLPPMAGDVAPNVTFIDAITSQPVQLSEFAGTIIVLDFWATWCGPCQRPMQQYNDMLTHNPAWKEKVVVLGASIDDDTDTIRTHVQRHGWNNIRHLWCGADTRTSPPVQVYGVASYPTLILIDASGIIREATGDVETRIHQLLDETSDEQTSKRAIRTKRDLLKS